MAYTKEQLDALSGAGAYAYKNAPVGGAYYDTITLGKDGKFYLAHYSQPKDKREDPTNLDGAFECTIVKIRRKLTAWEDKQKTLESVEYDAGATTIPTTKGTMSEKEAKEHGAKVALMVYAIFKGNLVKIQVTGGSLYNPEDTEHLRLYSYLQSYGDEESVYDYSTVIGAKENHYTTGEGVSQSNYQMVFKRTTTASNLDEVGAVLTQLATDLPENDARDLKFLGSSAPKATTPQATEANKAFDAINPDDVPF